MYLCGIEESFLCGTPRASAPRCGRSCSPLRRSAPRRRSPPSGLLPRKKMINRHEDEGGEGGTCPLCTPLPIGYLTVVSGGLSRKKRPDDPAGYPMDANYTCILNFPPLLNSSSGELRLLTSELTNNGSALVITTLLHTYLHCCGAEIIYFRLQPRLRLHLCP